MTLLRITAPHFVAGVVVGERAAPIIGYMKRWEADKIRAYARRRGWTVEVVAEVSEEQMPLPLAEPPTAPSGSGSR